MKLVHREDTALVDEFPEEEALVQSNGQAVLQLVVSCMAVVVDRQMVALTTLETFLDLKMLVLLMADASSMDVLHQAGHQLLHAQLFHDVVIFQA